MNSEDMERNRQDHDRASRQALMKLMRDKRGAKTADAEAYRLQRAEALMVECGFVKKIRDDGSVYWECTE